MQATLADQTLEKSGCAGTQYNPNLCETMIRGSWGPEYIGPQRKTTHTCMYMYTHMHVCEYTHIYIFEELCLMSDDVITYDIIPF